MPAIDWAKKEGTEPSLDASLGPRPPAGAKAGHDSRNIPAVVVGFNIHGLAVARALARAGIDVHALSPGDRFPANHTRYATVHLRRGVNSNELLSILKAFARQQLGERRAVLFPTSDNMVRVIGQNWDELQAHYLLSWSDCTNLVLELQKKSSIPAYCEQTGVPYPVSKAIKHVSECAPLFEEIQGPLIVKPVRPLSSFKAIRVDTRDQLERVADTHPNDLPFVVQQYIEGGDDSLYFCSMFLAGGTECASSTGRKLRSNPLGLGQGTVMTTERNDEVLELTRRFVSTLPLSGPIAVEFKRDPSGKYWLIEPNVGRTEYCVDLLVQSGFNFPLIEYTHAAGHAYRTPEPDEFREMTWYDTEKDPFCYARHCWSERSLAPCGHQPIFPYWGHDDVGPALRAAYVLLEKVVQRISRRLAASRR